MSEETTAQGLTPESGSEAARGSLRRKRRRQSRRLSVVGVAGEVLITAGILILGYIVWQPWYTGTVVTKQQTELSDAIAADWRPSSTPQAAPKDEPSLEGMPVLAKAPDYEVFAVMHVPAFAPDFQNVIAETTDLPKVLNLDNKGVGHYDLTQQLGEPGNFAVAGHRSGPLINAFKEMMNLRVGDPIFVETEQGWFTYRFRSIEYVWPTAIDVLNPFPRLEGTPGTDHILTLTTCHPKWDGDAERAIAYAVLEDFTPAGEGMPAELVELKASKKVS